MKVSLDTNRYSDFMRGVPEVFSQLELAQTIVIPVIVIAELRSGFAAGTLARKNTALLERFLARPDVAVADIDDATTHIYAGIFATLKLSGTLIPTNDIWIAALTMQVNAVLLTCDAHFKRVAGLQLR